MADTLDDLLDDCRDYLDEALDEEEEGQFSDRMLIKWCNEALTLMARASQCIRLPIQFPTVENVGEYALKLDVTDIWDLSIYDNNTTLGLTKVQQKSVQRWARRTGTPRNYYLRFYSAQLTYQNVDGLIQVIGAQSLNDQDLRVIVGLDPMPDQDDLTITLDCCPPHPKLKQGTDRVLIPDGFAGGASAWATAKALQKEKYFEEARHYYELFNDYNAKLCEYMAQAGHTGHAKMRVEDDEAADWDPQTHGVLMPND